MAEGRIQGLSIGLGMQSTEVSRSISEVKRSIRGLNSEAKVTNNNMKYGARDTKSYKQNMDQLSGVTEKQRKNVDELGKRYAAVVEEQGASSKAAQNLATEFNKQADNLNRLESQLSSAKDELHGLYVEQSKFTRAGNAFKTAGSNIQDFGGEAKRVGGGLTKWITAPVIGAATAVGGLTAALGWGRLTGLDSAKSQLEGLGYSAKEVKGITNEVSDSIQGGMMTMAEGTATAAGAMAAGVERGAELERYLKLVDAAAVGANRPVGEMAQIFNRVQGSGKLMTEELNRIEDGMPGFSLAMAEHMGVGLEEFRKMVSDGKVQTNDFMDVMEDFAGGMAEAQSKSWSGMLQNTKAWIGIIGENLLGGVFEQSKESVGEFLELLKSDSVQKWATETGEKLSDAFTKIVSSIKTGVNWFKDLSSENKKLIGIIAAVAVAAGPLLTIFGTMTIFIGSVVSSIAPLFLGLGKLAGGFKAVRSGAKTFSSAFPKLAGLFGLLTGPIGITVAAIAALGAGFIIAYKKSETFRNFIGGIGEKFRNAMTWIGDFKDGILGLFKDDGTGGVDILTSIGISEGMANRLNDMVGKFFEFKWKVEEVIGNVKTTIKGIFAIFKGDHLSANELLYSIGLSEGTIDSIFLAVERVKSAFRTTKEYVTNALSAVGTFLRAKIAEISAFWQSDGQQILQATKNVFSGVSAAVSGAIKFIVPIIRTGLNVAWSIFKFVWPAILALIKMVWGNIKGVINGGLNVIKGLIQVFSGIFTGDFSKMWEGVKNIFKGAIEFVWNLFQLMFYGRIIKGIMTFVKGGLSLFRNFGSQTGNLFKNLWKRIVSIFTGLWRGSVRIFNNLKEGLFGIVNRVSSGITNTISRMVGTVVKWFRNLLRNGKNIFTNLKDGIISRIRSAKDRVVNFANSMKDKAIEKFKGLSNGARDMMNKVGDWIDNKKQAVIKKATSLGTGIANAAIKGFNKLIGGINKVGSMLGIDSLLDKIPLIGSGGSGGGGRSSGGYSPARYSTGTNYHKGGAAIVGDKGPGNGGGTSEIVSLPNGRNWLFNKETLIDDLPTGAKVLNNKKTEKKFGIGGAGSGTDKDKKSWVSRAFDWGKDKASSAISGISGAFSKVGDFVSDAWDYMKNPGELASKLVSNLDLGFDLPSTALDLAAGGVKKLTSHIGKFFGKWFDTAGGEVDGGSILNRRITAKFGRYPAAIARQLGVTKHYGLDTAHKYEKLTSPVTGKVTKVWHDRFGGNSIQIKAGKANWWFMHMKSIARQVGDMVKAGSTKLGITGNTGLRTTGYHLHSQKMVGGIGNKYAVDPLPDLKKANSHLLGGQALSDGLVNVHSGEYIINPNKPTQAMKLLALAGKDLTAKSKQTRQLPNPTGGSNDDNRLEKYFAKFIDNQQRQIEKYEKMIDVLLGIEDKSGITEGDIHRAYDSQEHERRTIRNYIKGRKGGGLANV